MDIHRRRMVIDKVTIFVNAPDFNTASPRRAVTSVTSIQGIPASEYQGDQSHKGRDRAGNVQYFQSRFVFYDDDLRLRARDEVGISLEFSLNAA
jgi:hypothetical protein